jgi:hypothetical protein
LDCRLCNGSAFELSSTDRKLLLRKGWQVGCEPGVCVAASLSFCAAAAAEPRVELVTSCRLAVLLHWLHVRVAQATVGVSAEASLLWQDPHAKPLLLLKFSKPQTLVLLLHSLQIRQAAVGVSA